MRNLNPSHSLKVLSEGGFCLGVWALVTTDMVYQCGLYLHV